MEIVSHNKCKIRNTQQQIKNQIRNYKQMMIHVYIRNNEIQMTNDEFEDIDDKGWNISI